MFEAFRANKGKATGVVQWMLNAAWPKMYWQLYDKFLMPTGAFYGARKACQPLHLLYNYAEHSVCAVNDHLATFRGIDAWIRILDVDSRVVFSETLEIDIQPDSSAKILDLPELGAGSTTYFLDLRLHHQKANFYWLSTKPDVLDYETKVEPWPYYTPSKEFADFTALNSLPVAKIEFGHSLKTIGPDREIQVRLKNTGEHVAFFVELKVLDKESGQTILPVFWDDNYISILPGESRTIGATFADTGRDIMFVVDGWNLEA